MVDDRCGLMKTSDAGGWNYVGWVEGHLVDKVFPSLEEALKKAPDNLSCIILQGKRIEVGGVSG